MKVEYCSASSTRTCPASQPASAGRHFARPEIRLACRKLGYIENTHRVSHGYSEASRRNLEARKASVFPIEVYPKWRANGLRDVFCVYGSGRTYSRTWRNQDGSVSVAVEGSCECCGTVHITSGEWRRTQNPDRFVRIVPADNVDVKDADLQFGNFLTRR